MKRVRVEWTEVSTTEFAQVYDVPDDFTIGEDGDEDSDRDDVLALILSEATEASTWINPVSLSVDERWVTDWTFES